MADFLNECLSDPALSAYVEQGPEDFAKVMCRACRNTECDRSISRNSDVNPWVERMATQEDRLLLNPQFADPKDPQFAPVRGVDFKSAFREAISLEIAATKGDWSIPSGQDAVEFLSARKADDPKPPDRLVDEVHVIPDPSAVQPEPPGPEANVPTKMEVARSGRSRCRHCHGPIPNGVKRFGRYVYDSQPGKAIWTWYHPTCAGARYPEELEALGEAVPTPARFQPPAPEPPTPAPLPAPAPVQAAPAPAPEPPAPVPQAPVPAPVPVPVSRTPDAVVGPERRNFTPTTVNTPMPKGGITLGGPTPSGPATPPAPAHDPWAVPTAPTTRVVKSGATVSMGGKKDK